MSQAQSTQTAMEWPKNNFSDKIALFRRGNPEALVDIFKTLEPDLNRYYWYCFGRAELVEEGMQEFYQLMVTRLLDPKYNRINIALYRILRKDGVRRVHRFLKRYSQISIDDPDFKPLNDGGSEELDILYRMQLMDCLDQLNQKYKRVMDLHYFEDLPLTDIPQAFQDIGNNVSYENVRQIVVRALKQLKKCMNEGGD